MGIKRSTTDMDTTGWVQVVSSNVRRIKHNGAPSNTLLVRFKDGSVYAYFDCPRDVFRRMLNSASKGRFVARVLTPNYAYEKVAEGYDDARQYG